MAELIRQFCCDKHASYELEVPMEEGTEEEGVKGSAGTIAYAIPVFLAPKFVSL